MSAAPVAVLLAGSLLIGAPGPGARLDVPIVRRGPERCGPAALEMALRYYGAGPAALREADAAYDPRLRGTLITDLAAAARRAGFEAEVRSPGPDSLVLLLAAGVPPVVLYGAGRGPVTTLHYGVLTGWDPARERFTLNDGGARPRTMSRDELERRRRPAGGRALIVRPRSP